MKFGVLGDAKIGRTCLIPAIRAAGHDVVQVGRRDPTMRSDDPIYDGVMQTSYEDVLANRDIDAIYNPLPNHLHVPMTVAAIRAGKHVLCEKPIALNRTELANLEAAAQEAGCFVYEGYMIRHHPQWEWIQNCGIGIPRIVHATFTYPTRAATDIRSVAAWGGGPIYDIGCYAVLAGTLIFGGAPERIMTALDMDDASEMEQLASGMLVWSGGRHLLFSVASTATRAQSVQVIGTEGTAFLLAPFNPPPQAHARIIRNGEEEIVNFQACNQYTRMVADFVASIEAGQPSDFGTSHIVTACLEDMLAHRKLQGSCK